MPVGEEPGVDDAVDPNADAIPPAAPPEAPVRRTGRKRLEDDISMLDQQRKDTLFIWVREKYRLSAKIEAKREALALIDDLDRELREAHIANIQGVEQLIDQHKDLGNNYVVRLIQECQQELISSGQEVSVNKILEVLIQKNQSLLNDMKALQIELTDARKEIGELRGEIQSLKQAINDQSKRHKAEMQDLEKRLEKKYADKMQEQIDARIQIALEQLQQRVEPAQPERKPENDQPLPAPAAPAQHLPQAVAHALQNPQQRNRLPSINSDVIPSPESGSVMSSGSVTPAAASPVSSGMVTPDIESDIEFENGADFCDRDLHSTSEKNVETIADIVNGLCLH
jgi:chromosome segregation ATPase